MFLNLFSIDKFQKHVNIGNISNKQCSVEILTGFTPNDYQNNQPK